MQSGCLDQCSDEGTLRKTSTIHLCAFVRTDKAWLHGIIAILDPRDHYHLWGHYQAWLHVIITTSHKIITMLDPWKHDHLWQSWTTPPYRWTCSFPVFILKSNHANHHYSIKYHVQRKLMKTRGSQISLQASDHPKRAHSSNLGQFFLQRFVCATSIHITNILHIRKKGRRRSKVDLFGTFCAGFSPSIQYGGLAGQMWAAGCQKIGLTPQLIRQGAPNLGLFSYILQPSLSVQDLGHPMQ
eukprot:333070-Pelagomonas_calceolata.AAC.2